MAITSGRTVKQSDLPVLPTAAETDAIDRSTEWARLRDSGKYLIAVGEDGDWVEIPLDETGLPLYETIMERPIPPKTDQRKRGK